MSLTVKRKDGRRYKVDLDGINTLRRKYQVVMDSTMDSETLSFPGVPAIGSAHPDFPYLYVKDYDVDEGEGSAKKTLTVWANYERSDASGAGGADGETACDVEQWGWDAATDSKELVMDIDKKPVLNSAGDPFDSVPQVSVYSPVFTKVVKFWDRQEDAMEFNCKLNKDALTIGSMACPAGTLLCSVAEQRIIGDKNWKYRYTINLKFKTNKVCIARAENLTEIGWDVAITDTGMRELDDSGKPVLIQIPDYETGAMKTVTSPELLDGNGHAVARSQSSPVPTPYIFRFKAYERADIPEWFYTESDIKEYDL